MTVVVPYVLGLLDQRTTASVMAEAPDALFTALDPSDVGAYPRLLCDLWADGLDFTFVEEDVEPPPGWLADFESCRLGWCIREPHLRPGLDWMGCVRFRGWFTAELPDAAVRAMSIDDDGDVPWTWRKIDVRLARVLRGEHRTPHWHWPPCQHHRR